MKVPNFKFIVLFVFIFFCVMEISAQDSKIQKEIQNKLHELHKPTFKTRDSLFINYKAISEKISYTTDTVIKNNLYKKIIELDKITIKNNDKELKKEFDFIKQYNTNTLALDILYYKIRKRESSNYYDTFNSLYNSLSSDLQNSSKGIELRKMLVNFNNSNIGKHAPDFNVKDIRNTSLSLSSFENKNYVLLNFWDSNSQACKEEVFFLKELYFNNKLNDLELVSISLDESIEVLRKAIDYEKIDMWHHIPIIMNEDAFLLDNYFVNSIPQKILIDKNGIIIGRWRGSSENNHKEINNLLTKLFNVVATANATH